MRRALASLLARVSSVYALSTTNQTCDTVTCYTNNGAAPVALLDHAIDYMCTKYNDFNLGVHPEPAEVVEVAQAQQGIVVMSIQKRVTMPTPACNYTIIFDECKTQLGKAVSQCPDHGGGEIVDEDCGLTWSIEYEPRETISAAHGKSDDDPPNGMDVGPWVEQRCYDSGFQWTREMFLIGADKFCYWATSQWLLPGYYLNFTHHFCISGEEHKQWFQAETKLQIDKFQYAICMLGVLVFLDDCNPDPTQQAAVHQGGWGINSIGYLIVDGDPDLHNPGNAQSDWGCGEVKASELPGRTFGHTRLDM